MEDKIINCKDANINFNNTIMTLLLTIPALFGFLATIVYSENVWVIIMVILFIIIDCIVMYFFAIRRMMRNIVVRRKGIIIHSIVKGYCDDNYLINEEPAQKILLTLKTSEGEKNIYYKLSNTKKDYEINREIELYSYKDIYLIKDEIKNNRQRCIIAITFIILIIMILYLAINIYIPLLFNLSPYQMKMNNIEKNNKEVRVKFNELEYDIPEDYHLSLYQEDWEYQFEDKNENHDCVIDLLSMESERSNTPVGQCKFYNINNRYEEYNEVLLNGDTWCYITMNREEIIEEKYMINDGKNYYSITLYNYKDNDEKCSVSFNEFKKTIKLNK